ncbi:hypothetical protein MA5S0921_4566 [Mycobacteroides abscessus 5S-0921]|nr:hypothetical protein MA5S0921_4566 [Mycobacteroides abscessus 5S-0921]
MPDSAQGATKVVAGTAPGVICTVDTFSMRPHDRSMRLAQDCR